MSYYRLVFFSLFVEEIRMSVYDRFYYDMKY